uniref:Ig-like domain-containing protein n=1 Tax=Periophthalmus magnuspinnatus TaxID=409849 RepID=A0A3B3ZAU1_9GOBI
MDLIRDTPCKELGCEVSNTALSHADAALGVFAPHMYYTCPEGATVTLVCNQRGAMKYPQDKLHHPWFFTQQSDQHCSHHTRPRNIVHKLPPGVHVGMSNDNFWLTLENVSHSDQGRYCCMALDVLEKADHHKVLSAHIWTPLRLEVCPCNYAFKRVHPHILFDLFTLRLPSTGSVPVALAVAACVLALLSLPLILILVYKQRHSAHSSRRDEAQGHENPVFLGGSPQVKTRTVSQIMTRQSSETGRHLLSDAGTPLSPPGHGDVFFPAEGNTQQSNVC